MSSTQMLSAIALVGIIGLTGLMMFVKVPSENHDFVVAAFASLATALTIGGGSKIADKLTQSGPDATITPGGQ